MYGRNDIIDLSRVSASRAFQPRVFCSAAIVARPLALLGVKTTVDLLVYCFTNVGRIKLRYVNLNDSYDVT